jgi:pyruvate,orthophosphate dikinase
MLGKLAKKGYSINYHIIINLLDMHKWIYFFSQKETDGSASLKTLLGGKGANLAEMCSIGLPVPPGFTITTEACNDYYKSDGKLNDEIKSQVTAALEKLEQVTGLKLGSDKNPLLISVRSGARTSMPGMMDTILNLGLNDETVETLAKKTNNPRFAYDSYRRLIQMYGDVVLGIEHDKFESLLSIRKRMAGVTQDTQLEAEHLKQLVADYKKCIQECGKEFPQSVIEQMWSAIGAVFESWMNDRAVKYRQIHGIPRDWGTAVNIQAMVFGNLGDHSATGVCFTRDPSTGENAFYGEYLINAQGEDVVAGIRTPAQITKKYREKNGSDTPALEETMPAVYKQLCEVRAKLEEHYRDMQDIEFTVQENKLWMLQTRNGKRSAQAAINIAVNMVQEGLISKQSAILSIDPKQLEQLLHPTLDPNARNEKISKGLPASPGAAYGKIVFSSAEAERLNTDNIILVRNETSPEDIGGMNVAQGILTARGGMTSHAAVVARGMGKPCIVGAGELTIDTISETIKIGNKVLHSHDEITIDGTTGNIYLGKVTTVTPKVTEEFSELMSWVDELRTLGVRANADTPQDAKVARDFGAEGIGLCRTEHMFFKPERLMAVREMILAETKEEREKALAKILPYQRNDFKEIFKIMTGLPVTIRLLDPPLHEFLPKTDKDVEALAKSLGIEPKLVRERVESLTESNPMLGHRGCRLAITYPEIYNMQVRAILEAAVEVDASIHPEIMIPLVLDVREIGIIKHNIAEVADLVRKQSGKQVNYTVGTMIELPRAALRAEEIAMHAEFFSFGTNDLTQTTLGISRDDAGKFLKSYQESEIFDEDPFTSLDQNGVGELIKFACVRGMKARPDIKLGICGEHGGHPKSIEFFHKVGLDYVSCSPYRVPVARLSSAQAAIRETKGNNLS